MGAQMRLLVVEDTRPLAEYVSVACHAKGFVVDLAYSLSEARAAVAGTFYETIVLDLGLPDGDGLEWLQEIRRAGLHLLFSSSAHATLRRRSLRDWISVPTTI